MADVPQTTACRFEMILAGATAMPKSCPQCGLGGCKKGIADPWHPQGRPPNVPSCVQPSSPMNAGAIGQRDMQRRAALAVIRSGKDKGLTEEQRELLAEAAEAVLALDVTT